MIIMSDVQFGLKLYAWFEIIGMISDQNCTPRSSVTTQYYIHFEIAKFSRSHAGFFILYKCFINLVASWLKKVANLFFIFMPFLLFVFKQAIICFILVKRPLRLRKRWDLEQKIVRFVNKSHKWEAMRLQGSPVISKGMGPMSCVREIS